MKQRAEQNVKKNIANSFGSFGYLLCFLQWLWVSVLYFSVIQSISSLLTPHSGQQVEQSPGLTFSLPNSSEMIILGVVTTIMVAIAVYALIKIPMDIVKNGNKFVHKTAETMTPVVIKAQHKKDTKKFHAKMSSKLTLAIKLLLVIIPLVFTAASGWLEKQPIDYSIVMILGSGLACFSLVFFTIQYVLAGLFRVKMSDLW
jgi:hypothetical protein